MAISKWAGPASLLSSLTILLVLSAPLPAAPATAERPNVVIIFCDDLGYGDLSCYGRQDYQTPHLDQMAAEGVRLTDFYVATASCAPSRAALLTGRYPFRTGVPRNPTPDQGIHTIGLDPNEITLAEALKEEGYATACIGKWHLGHLEKFYPRRHGFDEYFGILYSNDMRPVELVENELVVEYPVVQSFLTERYTDRAIAFMERATRIAIAYCLPQDDAAPTLVLCRSDDQSHSASAASRYNGSSPIPADSAADMRTPRPSSRSSSPASTPNRSSTARGASDGANWAAGSGGCQQPNSGCQPRPGVP